MMKIVRVLTNSMLVFFSLSISVTNLQAQKSNDFNKKNFERQITSIDSLIEIGQPESAKKLILKFKSEAEKANHTGYKLVALGYLLDNNAENLEDEGATNRHLIEEEINKSTGDYKALLLLEKAKLISGYFNDYIRFTEVNMDTSSDYSEWSKEKIQLECFNLIEQSIQLSEGIPYSEIYQPLDRREVAYDFTISFKGIIIKEAIEVLNLFKYEDKTMPDSTMAYAIYSQFINQKYESKDPNKINEKILNLYQILSKENQCFFDAMRLTFVHSLFSKVRLYKQTLLVSLALNRNIEMSNLYALNLVKLIQVIEPSEALKIAESAIERHPNFKLNSELINIKNRIVFPEFDLKLQNQIAPNKPSLFLVNYKNCDTLYFECYKIDYLKYENEIRQLYFNRDEPERALKYISSFGEPAVKGRISLINFNDYKSRSIEASLPPLTDGVYLLAFRNKSSLNDPQIQLYLNPINVYKNLIVEDNSTYKLLSAENGQPISNQSYNIYKYSSKTNNYIFSSKGLTDKSGAINTNINSDEWYNDFIITTSDNNYYYKTTKYRNYDYNEKDYTNVKILTDRGLYRPGQTIQFKCIAYKGIAMKTVPKIKFTVNLFNNGENKGKIEVTTNAYGSAVGKFKIPESGTLSGEVYITVTGSKIGSGSASVRVEEYKLSKFTVEIKEPESSFKLGDNVSVKGNAKALAGYALSGAKFSYSIKRVSVYKPYYWYKPLGIAESTVIKTSEGFTDINGNFDIEFEALRSSNLTQNQDGFNFVINGSITDLNGEVKIFNKEIYINESSLRISIGATTQHLNHQDLLVNYSITNTSGKIQAVTAKIEVFKLEDISEAKKSRYWTYDTTLIPDNIYQTLFPDVLPKYYSRKQNLIKTFELFNDTTNRLTIDKQLLNQYGLYVLKISAKDKEGKTIEAFHSMYVLGAESGKFDLPNVMQLYSLNGKIFEPGSTAKIALASGFIQQSIKVTIRSKRGVILDKLIQLNNEIKVIDIPILAADRGNISVDAYTVNGYRISQNHLEILVPFSNKQLQVKVKSFRSDIEPGSKEKWILSMNGPAAEKAAMELAAVMYDAALDEIVNDFNWNFTATRDYDFYFQISHQLGINQYNYYRNLIKKYPVTVNNNELYFPEFSINWLFLRGAYNREYYDLDYAAMELSNNAVRGKSDGYAKDRKFKFSAPSKEEVSSTDSAVTAVSVDGGKYTLNQSENISGDNSSGNLMLRKNFNETAFFFPQLYVNTKGDVSIEFTMPEALTKWKLMLLGHSTTLQTGTATEYVTTSKQLMVQPNLPRFLREHDQIVLSAKIINNSKSAIDGKAKIILKNEINGEVLNWLVSSSGNNFSLKPGEISTVKFNIKVPDFTGLVSVSISAESATIGDGELKTLVVLTNRTLVQTALPFTIRKAGSNQFDFNALLKSQSVTLTHQKLSVEICQNPAWNAVMAMPYLMEFPNECAEQLFSRIYANSISLHLIKSNPKIKEVYAKWLLESKSNGGFSSKLDANQDLKMTVLSETPWLNDANSEKENMSKMAALFKENTMKKEIDKALNKLEKLQQYNGGFPWFSGMDENEYITQSIVIGFGKLNALGVDISAYKDMINKAIQYIDKKAIDRYNEWLRRKDSTWNAYPSDVNYLYAKSYFPAIGISITDKVLKKNIDDIDAHWMQYGMINKANLAVALNTLKPESNVPSLILKSFSETAKKSEEMGMYWSKNTRGWYWYEAPEETQAAIIEAYAKVSNDMATIKELQIWLLRQKQTQSWSSTKSTSDAIFVLIKYNNLLNSQQSLGVKLGSKEIVFNTAQAGTGYSRADVPKADIKTEMGKVTINTKTADFSYGAVHWQYFEDLDKVTNNTSGLSISKALYKSTIVNGKEQLELISQDYKMKVGDIITVVLSISSDRNLEFVHVKDSRASGAEPIDVLSQYKYQNGIGYYMVTKDVSTNFFIDYLYKGKYQLSYQVSIQQEGEYSSGIAQIQCMYAPEFIANSSGMKLKVE